MKFEVNHKISIYSLFLLIHKNSLLQVISIKKFTPKITQSIELKKLKKLLVEVTQATSPEHAKTVNAALEAYLPEISKNPIDRDDPKTK